MAMKRRFTDTLFPPDYEDSDFFVATKTLLPELEALALGDQLQTRPSNHKSYNVDQVREDLWDSLGIFQNCCCRKDARCGIFDQRDSCRLTDAKCLLHITYSICAYVYVLLCVDIKEHLSPSVLGLRLLTDTVPLLYDPVSVVYRTLTGCEMESYEEVNALSDNGVCVFRRALDNPLKSLTSI